MNEKYLPIGTIVTLKGATKKIMIIGYLPMTKEDVVYDYSACIFPEGVISTEQTAVFNHNQIDKIFCIGFSDEEEKNFKTELNKKTSEVNNNG